MADNLHRQFDHIEDFEIERRSNDQLSRRSRSK